MTSVTLCIFKILFDTTISETVFPPSTDPLTRNAFKTRRWMCFIHEINDYTVTSETFADFCRLKKHRQDQRNNVKTRFRETDLCRSLHRLDSNGLQPSCKTTTVHPSNAQISALAKTAFLVTIVDMLVPYETKFQLHAAKIRKSLLEDLRQASTRTMFQSKLKTLYACSYGNWKYHICFYFN